jgi:hypothetical protein
MEKTLVEQDFVPLFGDNYRVRFDDNYLDRLTDTVNQTYTTRAQARQAVFEYIEIF